MAQKSRAQLTQVVDQNVYDNTQKEILAEMVREVLKDYRDSHFNLIDDELKNYKYNSTQTLEQYLNTIAGAVPVVGRIINFDVGLGSGSTLNTDGIIQSAETLGIPAITRDSLIEMTFSIDVSNKRLIPVIYSDSNDWSSQNDICTPVLRRISTTRVRLTIREVAQTAQNLNIEIIAI